MQLSGLWLQQTIILKQPATGYSKIMIKIWQHLWNKKKMKKNKYLSAMMGYSKFYSLDLILTKQKLLLSKMYIVYYLEQQSSWSNIMAV